MTSYLMPQGELQAWSYHSMCKEDQWGAWLADGENTLQNLLGIGLAKTKL